VELPDTDADGYLTNPRTWSEDVAAELARREGMVDLSPDHWAIVALARQFYERTGVVPAMRPLVKLVAEALGADKGNSIFLLRLFPGSPARIVAKIAGLPRPTNCI
jgi:tRNA 2-thiouridine synthesizing protein E